MQCNSILIHIFRLIILLSLIHPYTQEADNNVKLIVLDRLAEIKRDHTKVMQGLVMDLLRALACPNMEIRRKTVSIAMDLVTPGNVDEVVQNLKREMNREEEDKVLEHA